MLRSGALLLTLLAGAGALSAEIVPGSLCVYNPAINPASTGPFGLQCNLYPSTDQTGGTGTFDGDVQINLNNIPNFTANEGGTITDGYLVIVKQNAVLTTDSHTGQLDDSNQSDWLQVLEFAPGVTQGGVADGTFAANYLDLFTAGCSSGIVTDTTCFPTFNTIVNAPTYKDSYVFVNETAINSYFYNPSPTNPNFTPSYTVNYVQATPEPATFAIGLSGLALIAVLRRRRIRRNLSGS